MKRTNPVPGTLDPAEILDRCFDATKLEALVESEQERAVEAFWERFKVKLREVEPEEPWTFEQLDQAADDAWSP